MHAYQVHHVEDGKILLPHIRWCDNFGSKLRGFTFRRTLTVDDGLVLVEKNDNRVSTAIHMLFVFFELGIIWVNSQGEVVDTVIAKPWRLSYVPRASAQYVLEVHPSLLTQVKVGDHLAFVRK